MRVNAKLGESRSLITRFETRTKKHHSACPVSLPDGKHFLYLALHHEFLQKQRTMRVVLTRPADRPRTIALSVPKKMKSQIERHLREVVIFVRPWRPIDVATLSNPRQWKP